MNTFQQLAGVANVVMRPLISAPVVGRLLSKAITDITYVGRKSGRTFSIPVGYKRRGDQVTIGVAVPDRKGWWRNFYPDGGPISIRLDGVDRPGHAVAHRKGGSVHVSVQLDPAG
ncbi:hypothetical protein [Rhodococcoides yunnanense]|uniref:hypothetical protein n=1 Tax=Rhodococcoides yunnanense TaxID=278209 RepID=UPI000932AE2F|nr:hypothetical protein [Rhodococcus yunnanensis]